MHGGGYGFLGDIVLGILGVDATELNIPSLIVPVIGACISPHTFSLVRPQSGRLGTVAA
jgi:uncharacterized membrane protein YeaQ/YmgE (transglycosylase-associated protein family)